MNYSIAQRTLHFRVPAGTSRGIYTERRVWYVTLTEGAHADSGEGTRSGIGECAPLPHLSCDDVENYEEILETFCQETCQTGQIPVGIVSYPSIRFGLECALLMLHKGSHRLFDTPFTRGETGMPINGLIWMGRLGEMKQRLEEKIRARFRCVKVKIGAIDWSQEMELLRNYRSRSGTGELRVDANGGLDHLADNEIQKRLEELASLNIHSIEQPVKAGQWGRMAHLCQSSPIPIALDEELIGVNDTDGKIRLLETIRPHYIVLKPSLHGGLSGCDEWIRLAQERGIGWWATSALESNVGLSAIAQWASTYSPTLPQGLGTGLLFTDNTEAETEVRGDEIFFRWNDAPQAAPKPRYNGDEEELQAFLNAWHNPVNTMNVQTSGSTGTPKLLTVEKSRMRASARMTCDFLGLHEGQTALLCMPLRYIAGQMMVVRALECGLRLIATSPSGHPLKDISEEIDFAAMVPMQVWNSLQVPTERERLRQIRHLLIGGGNISPTLEAELQTFPHAVWSSYGMTETLSHIALRRVSGPSASLWYTPLPGIRLSQSESGCLVINAPLLNAEILHTHDLVETDDKGRFRILGRTDNTISSSGVKIQLEEVEQLIQNGLEIPVQVTSRPDEKYGEALVLLTTHPISEARLRDILKAHPYWMPKAILQVDTLPTTETGKPNRAEAKKLATQQKH